MKFSTKMLCRSAIIAALYTALCLALGSLAWGPLQIRPAEALTILPLFYIEAVPGLWVGCMLANLFSGYGALDIGVGSLATLFAAVVTYFVGKTNLADWLKIVLGGIPVVVFNMFIIPWIMILGGAPVGYWTEAIGMLVTESVWVYVLGAPLYFGVKSMRQKNISVLL